MELGLTVEWIDSNDEYQYEDVMFYGEPKWDNDSFSYAGTHCTGGQSGVCELPSYTVMDSYATWDKTKYNTIMNEIIEKWVNEHTDYIEEKFCAKLEEQSQPDY